MYPAASKDKTQINPDVIPSLLGDLAPKNSEEEQNAYYDLVLDEETGTITEQGISYLLMAMGILKPKHFKGLPVSPWMQKLIEDKKRQLSKADPGRDRHKQLEKWLKDAG